VYIMWIQRSLISSIPPTGEFLQMSPNVMESEKEYESFYESLGRHYPEDKIVYGEALGRARRGVVCSYLRRFADQRLSLLDVGCNAGYYSLYFASLGSRAHGIDISPSLIAKAESEAVRLRLQHATFEVANIETYESGPWDIVLFSEVLEHLRRPEEALRSIVKCLRAGGHLLLTTPAPAREGSSFLSFLFDRIFGTALLLPKTHEAEHTAIRAHIPGAFHFRHDEYYPIPLTHWLAELGFKPVRSYTFFTPERGWNRLNAFPKLQGRIPVVNLACLNNLQLLRRA
jgi:2-polyprenyl-3-methyl-5-hydroxy-6-metoxy-1,4-benzoquinol methylase